MAHSFLETEESEAARLGTAAHEVAARYIDSYSRGAAYNPKVGEVTSNNVVIDDEMLDAAEMYADDVRAVMISTGVFGGDFFGTERALVMPNIHEVMFGTADQVIIDTKNRTVYIWDFKYGHDPVEVFENMQLISYAAGVVDWLIKHTSFLSDSNPDFKFVFRVAQPRSFHRDGPIREWSTTLGGLQRYFDKLIVSAQLAISGMGQAQSGPHCRYCPARHGCEAALTASVRLYEVAAQALPLELSHSALAVQLSIVSRAYKQLEAIKDALEQQVHNHIKKGVSIPGYAAEATMSRESWKVDLTEVFQLGDLLGVDLRKQAAVTPKQAIKLGVDEAVIMQYSQRTSSGIKIVPDNGSKARFIFGEN